ncbi:MAG: isopenicillin N synthase family oxygenase [Alphaproteobacteria bacterium]|nr:isopenicillin N synthase family oxygenase [Alphaproteobacteria bacterium]
MTAPRLPVIDVSGLRSPELAQRAAVAAAFRAACLDTGFFYVSHHGVDDAAIARTFAASKRFFAQPLEVKQRIKIRRNRGYDGIGTQTLDHAMAPDRKESVLFGLDLPDDHPMLSTGLNNHAPNPWPEGLPGWREDVRAYFDTMDALARSLLRGMALSLDLTEDFFEPGFALQMSSVRLLHYPPHPTAHPDRELGAGAHTDWGLITILTQDGTGGLEVQLPSGQWIAATPIPGTFVVNVGDMMARWTNDLYRSTRHRVLNRSGGDRYSIAFFCDPNHHTRVACLPSCTGPDRPPRYAPTTCGEHLAEMYRKSYGAAA